MSTTARSNVLRTLVFALALLFSAGSNAWYGGYHGGGWGHGGGWHGGGWGYHGGGWHGGGWGYRGAGWGWGGTGVVVGVPVGGYYAPACRTVRVCNGYGHCWLRQSCY